MVAKDSEIIDLNEKVFKNNLNELFELIHATSHSLLYRMRKDGKYFIVKQSVKSDPDGRKILRREYEIGITLSHQNIIDVYEYRYEENYQDSIIMEYVEGRTLNDFLAESPSFKTRKRIFSELLDAIEYLHQKRIIHNDIKPENIIISRTGDRVKLIDLGLSDNDMHYALKSIGFTKGFSAPELIEERKSDVRSDIYSLGVLMGLIFGNRYSGMSKKAKNPNPKKRFYSVNHLRKNWERNYLKWAIPLSFSLVLLIGFGIISIVNFQKNKLLNLEETIENQYKELQVQKQKYETLQTEYHKEADSLKNSLHSREKHELLKKERLNRFRKDLKILAGRSLDSIKICHSYFEVFPIRHNFKVLANQYYARQSKTIDGEDISTQLYSILNSEIESAEKAFSLYFPN